MNNQTPSNLFGSLPPPHSKVAAILVSTRMVLVLTGRRNVIESNTRCVPVVRRYAVVIVAIGILDASHAATFLTPCVVQRGVVRIFAYGSTFPGSPVY